jgi:hypothetical protein
MSTSASVNMSKAIRGVFQEAGHPTISDIPTPELKEYADIVLAYAYDLQGELESRGEEA